MERKMRVTINSDQLDITDWVGKRQRLQTRIDKEIFKLHEDDMLPYKLVMTMEQYELLKNTPEMGDKGDWKYYEPKDRIYYTNWNCMEIVIK